MALPRGRIFLGVTPTAAQRCMLLGLAALLASCATPFQRPPAEKFRLDIVDNADARRFEITLTSLDTRAMCVSAENWPNDIGGFVVSQESTYLQVDAQALAPSSSFSSVYCPGGCGEHRIAPNATLRRTINYATFGDAATIAASPSKVLHFVATPYYCR